jgi:hypothetical protein
MIAVPPRSTSNRRRTSPGSAKAAPPACVERQAPTPNGTDYPTTTLRFYARWTPSRWLYLKRGA